MVSKYYKLKLWPYRHTYPLSSRNAGQSASSAADSRYSVPRAVGEDDSGAEDDRSKGLTVNTCARWTGLILQAALFSMFAGSASAQTSPSSWTGFYFGGGLSYERAKISSGSATFTTQQSSSSPAVSGSFTPQATEHQFNGQIFAGYRAQLNSFVGGLEANLNLGGTKKFAPLPTPVCNIPASVSPTNACVGSAPYGTLRDYGRIRAIGGYLVSPKLLAFLSAGAAFGQGNPFGYRIGASTDNGIPSATALTEFSNTQKNVVG